MGFKRRCPSLLLWEQSHPRSEDKEQKLQKSKGNGQSLLLRAGSHGLGGIPFQHKQESFLGLHGIEKAAENVSDTISRIHLSYLSTLRVLVPPGQELDNIQKLIP